MGGFWDLVVDRAEATPDAVVLADGLGRSLTAAELELSAQNTAAALLERGLRPGGRVSWQLPTCLEAAVLMAALSRLEVVQNPVIAALRQREWSVILDQVAPDLVVLPGTWREHDHLAMVRALAPDVPLLEVDHRRAAKEGSFALPAGDRGVLSGAAHAGEVVAPPRWVFYSSGTTGIPKGVRHTDASVIAACGGMLARLAVDDTDVYPIAFPIPHIGGAVMVALALRTGCRLVLFDDFDLASTPVHMAAHNPTLLGSALPFHLAYLEAQSVAGPSLLYPRLKACTSGGAGKPRGMHARIRDHLGGRGIVSSWGLTEMPLATHGSLEDSDELLDESEGRPAPGVEIVVVGTDGKRCSADEVGELRVRGPQLFAGYIVGGDDSDTLDADGFFPTGDLGLVRESGHVVIVGRLKDVIVRNAENVAARQVEEVLLDDARITDAVVFGVPDARTGERVCAAIALVDGADQLTLEDVAAHCRESGLARFKTPEQLHVVGAIPRNAMGKVLMDDLRAICGAG